MDLKPSELMQIEVSVAYSCTIVLFSGTHLFVKLRFSE